MCCDKKTAATPAPGNLHGYQKKGVARWAVHIWLKTKRIARGKKGKARSRMQKAEGRKDGKARSGRI
jgi:hypothetical protein